MTQYDVFGPRRPFLRPALRDTFPGYFSTLTQRAAMSQANRPCGAPIDFDVTKLQEPCRAAAAASQCAPLNQRAIARLNELRDRLERERRLSEALDEQGRKILVLQDESEENARKLREKIRRLVFSPDPDELA